MAMYSAKEMKDKMGGHGKVREMELKDNTSIKVWIPKNEFYYEKKHFNIQMVPKFKHASVRAVTCINSDGDVGECPVCEHIKSLWDEWRTAKSNNDEVKRKEIQNTINRLSTDMYYVNAIDISDKAYRCMSLRLTAAMFRDISKIIDPEEGDPIDINNVIWTIKKTNNNKKITYSVMEDLGDEEGPNPKAVKLTKNMAKICDRDEKDGGYINLDKAYSRPITPAEYNHMLFGVEEDEEDDEEVEEKPVQKKKPVAKPKVVEDEDEEMSLDDIDEEPVKKPVKKAPVKKQVVEEDDDDDLDLDEEPKPVQKKVAKKPVVEEDDDDLDLDEEPEPKPSKPVQKKKPVEVDDDDLDLDDMDEEPEQKPVKKAQPKKPVKQEVDDSDLDDLELDDVPF